MFSQAAELALHGWAKLPDVFDMPCSMLQKLSGSKAMDDQRKRMEHESKTTAALFSHLDGIARRLNKR
ncbi:hypothetical protein [Nevskia ramosa]|uniref:hypothetical protein n=1 Tax=Nevskia ramosa TaxID=64002 RepID=UPI003D0F929D